MEELFFPRYTFTFTTVVIARNIFRCTIRSIVIDLRVFIRTKPVAIIWHFKIRDNLHMYIV